MSRSVSVLSVKDKSVKLLETLSIGVPVADVAITPDGRQALIVLKQDNKIGILNIEGFKVSYDKKMDINVGNFLSDDISILKVEGRKVIDTGKRLKLPGSPAAMRGPK